MVELSVERAPGIAVLVMLWLHLEDVLFGLLPQHQISIDHRVL